MFGLFRKYYQINTSAPVYRPVFYNSKGQAEHFKNKNNVAISFNKMADLMRFLEKYKNGTLIVGYNVTVSKSKLYWLKAINVVVNKKEK